jgi:hypothetical protein
MARPILKRLNLKKMYPDLVGARTYPHNLDRYPAKMIPQMARFLVHLISKKGQTILDPFCGSGSVLIEAREANRHAIGIDANPLAFFLATVKTTDYDPKVLRQQLIQILSASSRKEYTPFVFPNAEYWFAPAALKKLSRLRGAVYAQLSGLPKKYRVFWKAMLASIVRRCSRADLRGPKPFISKRAREMRVGRQFDPIAIFAERAALWIEKCADWDSRVEEVGESGLMGRVRVIEGDARIFSGLIRGSRVDAVITSPPYLVAQDYYRASKLELFILGEKTHTGVYEWGKSLVGSDRGRIDRKNAAREVEFPKARRVQKKLLRFGFRPALVFARYICDMDRVIRQIAEVLRPGAPCALVSAHNSLAGVLVSTPDLMIEIMERSGFRLTHRYVDRIRSRWVPLKRNGHSNVIAEEHILVFRRMRSGG